MSRENGRCPSLFAVGALAGGPVCRLLVGSLLVQVERERCRLVPFGLPLGELLLLVLLILFCR